MRHKINSPFYEIDKLKLSKFLMDVATDQGLRPWNLAMICDCREEHFYHLAYGNCSMSVDILLILMLHLGVDMVDLQNAGVISRKKHASL